MPCYKQQPTLQNVRIRTAQDALQVFYAVARNILTLLTRRLDADERKTIKPGNVYVWEDRSATTSDSGGLSMERWTDGMSWGPSRIREEFLFYYQRESQAHDRSSSSGKPPKPIPESDKLIKQTYSVYVTLPEDQPQEITRKWHLTAYFNQRTVDNLGRIDDIPDVGRMAVPEGLFRSARAVKGKRDEIRRTMGQIIGPVSQQTFSPSAGSGALYTIFSSAIQHEPMPSPPPQPPSPPESVYEVSRASSLEFSRPLSARPSPPYRRPPSPEPSPYPRAPQSSYPAAQYALPSYSRSQAPALVPLEYLQSCPQPRRDPADVHYLQQLSVQHRQGSSPGRARGAYRGLPNGGPYSLPYDSAGEGYRDPNTLRRYA